ncbi:MAG: methyltransferase domain-containing protein [Actinophytocola sp.]|uniref:class I SAM-dependent methyltransferase n=1 Tax=Actinophytocola sp. TaxID=1872138 RepID=UPI003C729A3C
MTAAHGAVDYDAELRLYNEVLRPACDVRPGDHVLDIGCGTGQTTRQAADLAVTGSTLGVDLSPPAIAAARRLAGEDGPRNIVFECTDAQVHPFPDHGFDLAISRFGTMFFGDPVAAFTNIGRALRPAGRLVMMVWQARAHNEWVVAIDQALGAHDGTATGGPDPFSLADPTSVTALLHAAGFTDVTFAEVRQPVYYGPDTETALAWVCGFTSTKQALARLAPPSADQALGRLRETLADHLRTDGVWFESSAWLVTAHRPHGSGKVVSAGQLGDSMP